MEKTHFRKAFNSPYLSSADLVGDLNVTISHVVLEKNKAGRKEMHNTAYFVEKEIRKGEKLKPMILNVQNSKLVSKFAESPFIDDWQNIPVTIYVDNNVHFGREIMEGLRIRQNQPIKKTLTPDNKLMWQNALISYQETGSLNNVLAKVNMSEKHQKLLKDQANA